MENGSLPTVLGTKQARKCSFKILSWESRIEKYQNVGGGSKYVVKPKMTNVYYIWLYYIWLLCWKYFHNTCENISAIIPPFVSHIRNMEMVLEWYNTFSKVIISIVLLRTSRFTMPYFHMYNSTSAIGVHSSQSEFVFDSNS